MKKSFAPSPSHKSGSCPKKLWVKMESPERQIKSLQCFGVPDSQMSANLKFFERQKPQRAKTSEAKKKKTYYFTTGRGVKEENLRLMEEEIMKPYEAAWTLTSIEDVKKYWENEKNKKVKEKEASCANHHNHKSRLNVLWKSERLFVPEKIELPGGSLTEDIDPTFFKIVSGRPIKQKKNIQGYVQDIRDCFMTRLKTGYYLDEILLMDERHKNEKKKLNAIRENFLSYLKGFEKFLAEDHLSSSTLLETAKEEEKNSKNKLAKINGLKKELKKLEADVLLVEKEWRSLRMFQKFLYIISPSEWRKLYDPYYGKEDVGLIASDPCLFDNFREFPGDENIELDVKTLKFQEDVKSSKPPVLYFEDPQEVLNILSDLEKNNLRALTHCKELDYPAENLIAELGKVKMQFEQDEKALRKEMKYLQESVEAEEKNSFENESKMKEIVFGLFRDLITNEDYLKVSAWVEDAYEDAVAPNDSNLNLVEMIKEIELKHESLLLALDVSPNDITIRTTKQFYKQQKRELKEAEEAERKVHQMETLLKRLSKALSYPKKEVKERKMAPRSLPPEELMFKYKLPKILSKEKKDHLFFFGKTPENVRLYKPLCL